jgi:hypothetical protein
MKCALLRKEVSAIIKKTRLTPHFGEEEALLPLAGRK